MFSCSVAPFVINRLRNRRNIWEKCSCMVTSVVLWTEKKRAFKSEYLKTSVNLVSTASQEDLHLASLQICNLLGRVTEVMQKFLYIARNCKHKSPQNVFQSFHFFHITNYSHLNVFYSTLYPSQSIYHFLKIFITFIFFIHYSFYF